MKKLVLVGAVVALLSSCATVGTPAGVGFIYTDVTSGTAATSNQLGTKVGRAKATNVLGIVATGDAGIQAAAREGGISKISHVDQKQKSVLGIVSTSQTIVYGE